MESGLRGIGEMARASGLTVSCGSTTALVRELLDVHLRRLEDGLADVRRELSRIHALLDTEENALTSVPTRVTVSGADLAAAIDAVRFAVSHDPELPALRGILVEV